MAAPALAVHFRTNTRHLYADMFWYGILSGSAMAFLAVYAARLGATGFQISLLTAGPAIINLLFSLPAGHWLEKRPLISTTFLAAALHRAGYLILIPLPWLLTPHIEVWAIALITLLMSIPGTILAIGFNALLADVIPPDSRSEVVSRRNAIMAVSLTASTLISGQLLDNLRFPLNYQVVFGIGVLGAAMSTYHLGQVQSANPASGREPAPRVWRELGDLARPGLLRFMDTFRLPPGLRFLTRSQGNPLLRLDLLRGSFGPFLGAYLVFYMFQYMPIPLFPLAYVRVLNLSDSTISLGSALFYSTMLLISLRLGRLNALYGHKVVLVLGAMGYSLYPLLLGLARDPFLFWVASLLGGVAWGLVSAATLNRLMERTAEQDRAPSMALHNLALNFGILAGSFAGPVLGNWLGLQEALLLSAGLRIFSGLLLTVWG